MGDTPIGSYATTHAPQADAYRHHTEATGNGWNPHRHIIFEDYPFDEKQRLGKHIDLYHADEQIGLQQTYDS